MGIMMMRWGLAKGLVQVLVPAYFSLVAGSTVVPLQQASVLTTGATEYRLDTESPNQLLDANNNENSKALVNDQTLHGIVDWMINERQALDEEFWKNQNDEPYYLNGDVPSDNGNAGNQHSKGYERKLQASKECVKTKTQIISRVNEGVKKIGVCASKTAMGGAARRRSLKESDNGSHHRELSGGGINLSNRNITFVCILKNGLCTLDGQGNSRLFYGANTQLTMIGFELFNASSDDNVMGGAALSFFGSSNIDLYKTKLSHNNAQMGGAIMISNSTLSTRNVRYEDNVGKVGGAVYGINSNMNTFPKSRTRMLRNHAVDDGGAIYMIGGEVSLHFTLMSNNTALNSVSTCIALLLLKFMLFLSMRILF
jgi:hypothetical protein